MQSPEFESLHQKYQGVKSSQLNGDQFGTLVLFFPSLLVVASDGIIDEEEWVYVKYLAKFMADTYKNDLDDEARESLESQYFAELNFLISNLEEWEPKFVDTLRAYLETNPLVKEDVLEILYLFAEASDGESEEETLKINSLKEELILE
ncbi:MAG: hypothetical protein KTR26_22035 [Flammeovirgaceae bacterium]|nr:hypothetical protein [Flammeovirgaceae bacterium]